MFPGVLQGKKCITDLEHWQFLGCILIGKFNKSLLILHPKNLVSVSAKQASVSFQSGLPAQTHQNQLPSNESSFPYHFASYNRILTPISLSF